MHNANMTQTQANYYGSSNGARFTQSKEYVRGKKTSNYEDNIYTG